MYFHDKKNYHKVPESEITPESVYWNRRQFLGAVGAVGALGLGAIGGLLPSRLAAKPLEALPSSPHPQYKASEALPLSDENLVTSYNNFYEFTTDKDQVRHKVDKFITNPWSVEISGLVKNKMTLDAEEIFSMFPLEQRVYRLRCVETWSAVIPWDGIPLAALLKKCEPSPEAKYVKFITFNRPEQAPGMRIPFGYKWPYQEGLRLDEAMNDLTFLANGIYGKTLPKQNGAPLRLVVPWKYGFKSIKSIVKIELVKYRPSTFWNDAAPNEYGFFSNVNPKVDHPRWSQAKEKPLGSWFKKVDTLPFNGYAEEVAALYSGMDLRKNF